ncbi:MAG TPA: hypothetical protein VF881_06785 [Polyangiaceae bacterium]
MASVHAFDDEARSVALAMLGRLFAEIDKATSRGDYESTRAMLGKVAEALDMSRNSDGQSGYSAATELRQMAFPNTLAGAPVSKS